LALAGTIVANTTMTTATGTAFRGAGCNRETV
jgi:hypothetical protein